MGRRIYPEDMPRTPMAIDVLSRIIRAAESLLERQGERQERRGRRGGLIAVTAEFQTEHFYIWGKRFKSRWDLAIRERNDVSGALEDGVYIDSPDDEYGNPLPRPMIDLDAAKRALKELEPLVVLDLLAGEP